MDGDKQPSRRFYAVSHNNDTPNVTRGAFIPQRLAKISSEATKPKRKPRQRTLKAVTTTMAFITTFGVTLGALTLGYITIPGQQSVAAPIVVVQGERASAPTPLHYGVEVALTQPDFFANTRDAFLTASTSFIEADLTKMEIVYYEEGVEKFRAPILSKGKEGSWWETPAGLYEISYKAENHFSSFGSVYQPWSMAFQGNFFVHGWPYYPDGTPVPEGYSGGCIRLGNEDAEALFRLVKTETPILVHEADFSSDGFLYEPRIPEIETPHYLVADIESNTVLAASKLDAPAPIASITKLMTALIAAEHINLDKDVSTSNATFVQSLVPRLADRSKVSMYSLLQLLLVESSNEASEVIAAQVGRDRFIKLMNDKAAALGLEHTTFADPSGLSKDNTASVADLLRLTQYIYHNRSFIFELTANQNLPTAYRSGEFGELLNFNDIDGLESFLGGKVGETLAAKQTSVSLHEVVVNGESRVIALILLGSEDRAADITELYEYVKQRFGD